MRSVTYKILVLGAADAGKSSLIRSLVNEQGLINSDAPSDISTARPNSSNIWHKNVTTEGLSCDLEIIDVEDDVKSEVR